MNDIIKDIITQLTKDGSSDAQELLNDINQINNMPRHYHNVVRVIGNYWIKAGISDSAAGGLIKLISDLWADISAANKRIDELSTEVKELNQSNKLLADIVADKIGEY
jgi:DNA-binding ferritin-like protein (Dps family)